MLVISGICRVTWLGTKRGGHSEGRGAVDPRRQCESSQAVRRRLEKWGSTRQPYWSECCPPGRGWEKDPWELNCSSKVQTSLYIYYINIYNIVVTWKFRVVALEAKPSARSSSICNACGHSWKNFWQNSWKKFVKLLSLQVLAFIRPLRWICRCW